MDAYQKILLQNKSWAEEKQQMDDHYFSRLSEIQSPEFLWIGCSDSRVPANEITGTEPGEIFVHRNIANLVVNTDLNMLSVLKYAVEVLKIKHIIVCGHYGCGGVKAAITHNHFGLLNKWLRNIKDVYRLHESELEKVSDLEERTNLLVELNIKEQVLNLAKTSIIQKSWHYHQRPVLHGTVYGLRSGILKDIIRMDHLTEIDPLYRFDFEGAEEQDS
jgi:carbonic anhydrase